MGYPEDSAWCDITNQWCRHPYECDKCPLLWGALPTDCMYYAWICPTCASNRAPLEARLGEPTNLVGAYKSGLCESPTCERKDVFSIVLQLVAAHDPRLHLPGEEV